jgi:serine/threonine-protein kinase
LAATTVVEWQRAHTEDAPTNPSLHAPDIDPALERLILRCLEKDPAKRPSSAAQVALALPGGDPLAAAIAAGETPSPDMVAAVGTEGALRPAASFASLAAIVVLLAMLAVASQPNLHRMVPFERSSEALADRASTLIAQLGDGGSGVDRA